MLTFLIIVTQCNKIIDNIKQKDLWETFQKSVLHVCKVYDVVVQTEISNYDESTDNYQIIKNEFVNYYFAVFNGNFTSTIVRCFFGSKKNLDLYLRSYFDIRYSKVYLSILPERNI